MTKNRRGDTLAQCDVLNTHKDVSSDISEHHGVDPSSDESVKSLSTVEPCFYESLETLGETLESEYLVERFEGVKQNLIREIRGQMCTEEQAYAYLENFEMRLLQEQELMSQTV
ncbi:hypothetical protein ACN08Z_08270 [Rothia sp. P7181]|uniref:hypothetical protein n=1 Tax=Rothia sp. P7181 TaxID=3402663 RepID=UPI003ADC7DC4